MRPCPAEIRTERLLLRRWRAEDVPAYAALQANTQARRFYHRPLGPEESAAEAEWHRSRFDQDGFSLWVLARPDDDAFIGIAGVRRIPRPMPFSPPVDLVWFLDPSCWGRGYAVEAARAALHDVFARTDLPEVVAYTTRLNRPSQRVMEKIGMRHDPAADFNHPSVPQASPFRPCVLYRLPRDRFLSAEPIKEARA